MRSLAQQPFNFRLQAHDSATSTSVKIPVTISVTDDCKQFKLFIQGQDFDQLEEILAVEEPNADIIVYRKKAIKVWDRVKQSVEFVLVVVDDYGVEEVEEEEITITVEHSAKSKVTKVESKQEKMLQMQKGRKLEQVFPITFVHDRRDWKIRVDYDRRGRTYLLYINGREFGQLPIKRCKESEANDINMSMSNIEYVDGFIHYNSHEILSKQPFNWRLSEWIERVCRAMNKPVDED